MEQGRNQVFVQIDAAWLSKYEFISSMVKN